MIRLTFQTLAIPLLVVLLAFPAVAQEEPELPTSGNRVRTLAGPLPGAVGGVAADSSGTVFVADFGETVWKIKPWGEATVFATGLYGASGNAIDAEGNLLQSNFHGGYLTRIDRHGHQEIIARGLTGPVGVAVDGDGAIYVCACRANEISRIDSNGTVSSFATGNLFSCPNGITRTPDGHFYVVNFSNNKVVKVTAAGEASEFATVPGGGNGHITFARGNLYVTAFQAQQLYKVGMDGQVTHLAGTGAFGEKDGAALEATFTWPNGIAAGPNGDRLFVNDFLNRTPPGVEMPPKPQFTVRQIMLESFSDIVGAALRSGGLDAMTKAYRDWKADPANAAAYTEFDINGLGYGLLQAGQVEAAIRVFELNVESYPQSWNVHDSLGEALLAAGRKDEAIASYEKSVAINPGNANAVAKLKEIRSAD